jgi:hypothetical protein
LQFIASGAYGYGMGDAAGGLGERCGVAGVAEQLGCQNAGEKIAGAVRRVAMLLDFRDDDFRSGHKNVRQRSLVCRHGCCGDEWWRELSCGGDGIVDRLDVFSRQPRQFEAIGCYRIGGRYEPLTDGNGCALIDVNAFAIVAENGIADG